ncbi:Free methionine-R-sulfoxide reductase [bioreactor metagenome]|jgi:GAF domain-containing protein|uniref:Free methionine-R-sulfoxide reductase n=1 Tax=bioreactor metagenome TaxID=1076179 RepID=A0A645DUA1_9ZZZZ|nr:GAF domain-containing protein [Sphaerochaeta sp.]
MHDLGSGSVLGQLEALVDGWDGSIERRYCHLANAAAFLYEQMDDVIWLGFYLTYGSEGTLMLGPFQGKLACTDIQFGRGVCGNAAQEKRSIRIADVHTFAGHIACDSASNSELVVPLFDSNHQVVGVLDVDSASFSRFSEVDQQLLEGAAKILSRALWT